MVITRLRLARAVCGWQGVLIKRPSHLVGVALMYKSGVSTHPPLPHTTSSVTPRHTPCRGAAHRAPSLAIAVATPPGYAEHQSDARG